MGEPSLIGLTGGIAAGKSEVLAILGRLGAETLSTDAVVHELLAETDEVRDLLVERWGPEIAPEARVDRGKVAEIVFGRPDELAFLESVLHPRVGAWVVEWRQALSEGTELAVIEVPLLFESGMDAIFDATLAVVAADELRERRAAERGTGELEARSGRQLGQDEKAERATFVVHNDGGREELEQTVAGLWPELVAAGEG